VGDARICASCGRLVSTGDSYCAGCGVSFSADRARVEGGRSLPGFSYHLVQGFGWGIGLLLAGLIFTVAFWLLLALLIGNVNWKL
jgi:hypothetical protein